MRKIKIIYDRANCIGAGACAAMDPDRFEMADDGKADLLKGKDIGDGKWELIVEENEEILEAAMACPVEVIRVVDLETGEDLV